jgi:hypothetical protein
MSEAIGQPGEAALPLPMGIGEILSTAFQFYRQRWRTLLTIAAVVVVPLTLIQCLLGRPGPQPGRDHDLRARKERLTLETVRTDLQASAA